MAILIIFCICLLLAYTFEFTSKKTRIPSVLLLLLVGFIIRLASQWSGITIPDFSNSLPVLGTLGLILIVLEGALELEFKQKNIPVIRKAFVSAFFSFILGSVISTLFFIFLSEDNFHKCLLNSIPISIISSAIAIPASKLLKPEHREFVIYESSLSDIIGVIFFNFILAHSVLRFEAISLFFGQIILVIILSAIATIGMAYLLKRIDHDIKFLPLIVLIVLIYAISKELHLPGLIFIMILGIFLGNLDEFKKLQWINSLDPDALDDEVKKFKELTTEFTFLIRSLFFLIFGFLIEIKDLIDLNSLLIALFCISLIFTLRWGQLSAINLPLKPLVYIAPRGLISILLYLTIPSEMLLPFVNKALLLQIIVVSSFAMMYGLISDKKSGI